MPRGYPINPRTKPVNKVDENKMTEDTITAQKLEEERAAIAAERELIAKQKAEIAEQTAKIEAAMLNTPSRTDTRASIRSDDIGDGSTQEIDFSSGATIDRDQIAVVTDGGVGDQLNTQAYIKELAFNEDPLDIIVGEVNDLNAENPVMAGVQGEHMYFKRGQVYKGVKRKFVDSLIKREVSITTKNYKDEDNIDQTKLNKSSMLKHPITVLHDPAGELGRNWFQWTCEQAL